MKKALYLLSLIAVLAFTGCDKQENIQGQWKSDPLKVSLQGATSSSAVMTFTFTQDGNVAIDADISTTRPAEAADSIDGYQMSISAKAAITGTWQYKKGDHDEVLITFDDQSLNVNIDPQVVAFKQISESSETSEIDTLNIEAVNRYRGMLTPELGVYFSKFSKIEDIKVRDNQLMFEVDHHNSPDEKFILSAI